MSAEDKKRVPLGIVMVDENTVEVLLDTSCNGVIVIREIVNKKTLLISWVM